MKTPFREKAKCLLDQTKYSTESALFSTKDGLHAARKKFFAKRGLSCNKKTEVLRGAARCRVTGKKDGAMLDPVRKGRAERDWEQRYHAADMITRKPKTGSVAERPGSSPAKADP